MKQMRMSPMQRRRRLVEVTRRRQWLFFVAIFAGVWLASSPFVLGYAGDVRTAPGVEEVTRARDLAPIEQRAAWTTLNEVVAGLAVVVLGLLALSPRRVWAPWALAVVGIWLLFAPLVFWSPSPAAYITESAVGIALIGIGVLAYGMPGMPLIMKMGAETPPGWSYNPSSYVQRAPIIALGWLGFFVSRYLAAYQLGYIDAAWDPFFGTGTERILESQVSRAWPVSDAGLGSAIYAGEALMGYMGGPSRWRTMPWMVAFFGILVVPLGIVSIALVILQPVAVGTWCTLCLATAVAMVIMIPLTLDEVTAMLAFWISESRRTGSWLGTFLLGHGVEGATDRRTPAYGATLRATAEASVWGVGLPWNLLAMTVLGVWLMAAPWVVGEPGTGSTNSSVVSGALVITVAMIALAEVTRAARFLVLPAAAWIAVSGWLLGAPLPAAVNGVVVALLVAGLSLPRGPVLERYGDWQPQVR